MTTRIDLFARLETGLSPATLAALRACETACAERGLGLYIVGGAVRDLLLERDSIDLDLAVEGEVAPIAQDVASAIGGRAVLHSRFGTSTVRGAGFELDLARTRRETYERPGALPDVAPASLLDDLARRDFTINAMALRLTQPRGELIDPFHGQSDVLDGFVRVLHAASFQDDATRMLRAARYATRLGFKVERNTELFLRRDLAYVDAISGPRLRRELSLLFEQAGAVDGTLLAQRFGVLAAVHPLLRLDREVASRWREALAGAHQAPADELGFGLVADVSDDAALASLTGRLHIAGRIGRALSDLVRLRGASARLEALRDDPVAAVEALGGVAPAAIWALGIREGGTIAETCEVYLTRWRRLRPLLSGDDVIALGVTQGVAVGEALRALRRARLEGKATTRADEAALVKTMLGEKRG